MRCTLPSYRRAQGTDKKETGNEEGSTAAAKASQKISQQKLTVGLDLGDRSSWYCILDEAGSVLLEQRVSTALVNTARGLAKSYGEATTRLPAKAALVFRPRRGYACHARISDNLPHVLVAVNDEAEIDGIGCGALLQKLNLSLQFFGGFSGPCVARGI